MKYDWTPTEAWSKTGALLLASTLLYLSFCAFCIFSLPVMSDMALAVGILGGFFVWVAAMCYAMLARSARRAWGVLLTVSLLLGGCALVAELIP